jgi:hypothetical protein
MLNGQIVKKAILHGCVSGVILAFFLKVVEQTTHHKVYTLLLNVDYIPVINRYVFPETVEVMLHLVISILLCACLLAFIEHKKITANKDVLFLCIISCLIIGLVLFPTTILSIRTPPLTSILAWTYWLIGHGIYGGILGYLLRNKQCESV